MKFQYAPGTPGYGTKGIDGSSGLSGLGMYFSGLNGNTQPTIISQKISNNEILYQTSEFLPEGRKYQTGDVFLDQNAIIYKIDLALPFKYESTNLSLNTSSIFLEQEPQPGAGIFTRYSNKYGNFSDSNLIDSIYANDTTAYGGYTANPTQIYDNGAIWYSNINHVSSDIIDLSDSVNYYPYQLWSTNLTSNDDHIALVRERNINTWRFGNYNGVGVRDVSLYLDFKDIYSSGNFYINGNILSFPQISSMNYIKSNSASLTIQTSDINNDEGLDIELKAGDVLNGTVAKYEGGKISLISGIGSTITSGAQPGGDGGEITLSTGEGGDNIIVATGRSGNGGNLNFTTGSAGISANGDGGEGGNLYVNIGDGGDGGDDGDGGDGGKIQLYAGNGGGGHINSGLLAGKGGDIYIYSGNGGDNLDSVTGGGAPGNIYIRTGSYGNSSNEGKVYIATNSSGSNYNGSLAIGNGTAANPSLSFAGDSNTGLYRPDIDQLGITVGGTTGVFEIITSNLHFTPNRTFKIVPNGVDTEGDGYEVHMRGADSGINHGGNIRIYGGVAGELDYNTNFRHGGDVRIYGGNLDQLIGRGGNLYLGGGNADYSGDGGSLYLEGGNTDELGDGGNINISAGGGRIGGNINILGGDDNVNNYSASYTNIDVSRGSINLIPGIIRYDSGGSPFNRKSNIYINVDGSVSDSILPGNIMLDLGDRTNPAFNSGKLYIRHLENISDVTNYDHVIVDITTGEIKMSDFNASDINLKDIKSFMSKSLDSLKELRSIKFVWNDKVTKYENTEKDETIKFGLIAQDVEKVFPEIVYEKTKLDGFIYKNINYMQMIPVLVTAINELKDIVDQQQQQINQLLNK